MSENSNNLKRVQRLTIHHNIKVV